MPHMKIVVASLKFSGAYPQERNPVSVFWVHIRMDLEDKSAESFLLRLHNPHRGFARYRCGSNAYERVKQFFHSEIIHGAAKKYGRHLSVQVIIRIEVRVYTLDKFNVCAELARVVFPHIIIELAIVDMLDLNTRFNGDLTGRKKVNTLLIYAVNALEIFSHINGPA